MYCILSRSEVCNLGSFNILKFQSQNEMLITSRSSQKVLFSAKVIVFFCLRMSIFVVKEESLSG